LHSRIEDRKEEGELNETAAKAVDGLASFAQSLARLWRGKKKEGEQKESLQVVVVDGVRKRCNQKT
jgi:hypothetical protein